MKLKKKNKIMIILMSMFLFVFGLLLGSEVSASNFPITDYGFQTEITYNDNSLYSYTSSNGIPNYITINSDGGSYVVTQLYYDSINDNSVTKIYRSCSEYLDSATYYYLECSKLVEYSGGSQTSSSVTNYWYFYGDYVTSVLNGSQRYYLLSSGYSEEDLENAYNEGYNDGVVVGSNNGLLINSCTYNNLIVGSCDTQYYSVLNGSIHFDSLNDYVYDLGNGTSYSITFDFIDSISSDALLYVRFKETEGSSISFYNGNVLLETLYNTDLDSNQSDYYKTFRLSDFGQITSSFNKIIINNTNYDYSISEFGVLQYQSYDIGFENGEIHGEIVGFANGNIAGYNRGFKAGEQNGNNLVNMIGAIFTGPVTMFQQIFNFNVLGINFAGMLLGLVTLLVVIWLIKRFI